MSPIVTGLMAFFVLSSQVGWTKVDASSATAVSDPFNHYQLTVTGYNAVPDQTDDTPFSTSIGVYTNPQIVAARSEDLADKLPYGTVIAMLPATTTPDCGMPLVYDHIGLRVIADAMNARMRNKIDVLFGNRDFVTQHGLRRNASDALGYCRDVRIEVVGHIDPAHMPDTQDELVQMVGKQLLVAK